MAEAMDRRLAHYIVCQQRGHTPSGEVKASNPPWQVCPVLRDVVPLRDDSDRGQRTRPDRRITYGSADRMKNEPVPDLAADTVRHKIVVSARGGYGGAYVKCLCGWNFRSRYDNRVDAKAEKHLRQFDGEESTGDLCSECHHARRSHWPACNYAECDCEQFDGPGGEA